MTISSPASASTLIASRPGLQSLKSGVARYRAPVDVPWVRHYGLVGKQPSAPERDASARPVCARAAGL
jgi:hypothetical protein